MAVRVNGIEPLFSNPAVDAGTRCEHMRLAAVRAAKLLAEYPTRTAQDLEDLLSDEADVAKAAFDQFRGRG